MPPNQTFLSVVYIIMGFGSKLSGAVRGLGQKVQNTATGIGKKIASVEKQAQKGISKGIDLGQTVLNKVDKGIAGASGVIGSIKQGVLKGANVLDALQTTGLANMIPGGGLALAGLATGLRGGASGLKKLQDVGADSRLATGKAKNQLASAGQMVSTKVAGVAGKAGAKVERVGERAKALEAQTQDDIRGVRAAFQA
jgi:hypothetical protein